MLLFCWFHHFLDSRAEMCLFFWKLKTAKGHSEINWPLGHTRWFDFFPLLFTMNFCTSLLSGSLGISKLLKEGPCRLLQHDTMGIGFVLLVLSNLACILGKGIILLITLDTTYDEDMLSSPTFTKVAMIWIIVSTIPHLFFVSGFS